MILCFWFKNLNLQISKGQLFFLSTENKISTFSSIEIFLNSKIHGIYNKLIHHALTSQGSHKISTSKIFVSSSHTEMKILRGPNTIKCTSIIYLSILVSVDQVPYSCQMAIHQRRSKRWHHTRVGALNKITMFFTNLYNL